MAPSSFLRSLSFLAGSLLALLSSTPDGVAAGFTRPINKVFVSKTSDTNLTYVENSGICETTLGVHQVSGYVNVGPDLNMVRLQ